MNDRNIREHYNNIHNRNMKFSLILNTIHSANLNCKRLYHGAIANSWETDGKQHLFIKLKTLEMEVTEYTSIQR